MPRRRRDAHGHRALRAQALLEPGPCRPLEHRPADPTVWITTQFFPALSGLLSGLLLAALGPVQSLATDSACVACVAVGGAQLMPALRGHRRGQPAGCGAPAAYRQDDPGATGRA